MSPCHSCDDGFVSGSRRKQMFGLRASRPLQACLTSAFTGYPIGFAASNSWTRSRFVEDCCSIPQRDCGRFSRPSLLSTTVKARNSDLTLDSKNWRESRWRRSRVNFIVLADYRCRIGTVYLNPHRDLCAMLPPLIHWIAKTTKVYLLRGCRVGDSDLKGSSRRM
jgi:hypothetical protein